MTAQAVGRSDTWGVLSGGPGFAIEQTLEGLRADEPAPVRALRDLSKRLPAIRAHAELGEWDGVRDIETLLLRAVPACEDQAARRRLTEHLPVAQRPVPSNLAELVRTIPDVMHLWASCPDERRIRLGAPQRITLHDIVVHDPFHGQGLGTAALEELCRFADQQDWPIAGDLVPSATAPPSTVQWTAKWYHKHGFRCGTRDPSTWERGSHMTREPQQQSGRG